MELLEVLLEETNQEFSPGLVRAISKDLKKRKVMYFVKAVHDRVGLLLMSVSLYMYVLCIVI